MNTSNELWKSLRRAQYADERPPGSGKTLIARSIRAILPRLTVEEALDITRQFDWRLKIGNGLQLATRSGEQS